VDELARRCMLLGCRLLDIRGTAHLLRPLGLKRLNFLESRSLVTRCLRDQVLGDTLLR
jgi:hypothetical protein